MDIKYLTLDELIRKEIIYRLKLFNGNRTYTSRSLGMPIRTLRNKLSEMRYKGDEIPAYQRPVKCPVDIF
jgi:DNA-binding NtrC family response regulator